MPSLLFIVCLLFLDRITKQAALAYLKGRPAFAVIPEIIEFTYVENTGAAFGMLKGMGPLFFVLAAAVSVFLFRCILIVPRKKRYLPARICYAFIISGAIGNLIDRAYYGYVIDFIYFKPINFPVFNVADIYISCSSILLCILICFYYKDEDRLF